ncbi:MAG: trypsin-like peptidase domain-containing protein [bacterium]
MIITKKNILYILFGIVLTIFAVTIYSMVWPQPYDNKPGDKLHLNENVNKQRANAIVLAAKKVTPAVVSISVIQTRVVATSPFFSPYSDDMFHDFFRDFFPERYHEQQVKSLGTGVIISQDGYILTNEHVIADATKIKINLPDGRQLEGTVLVTDRTMDLALLKVDAKNLPYVELGDSDDLMIGEWVIAFGNPFGFLLEDTSPTVTVGVVSALGRSIKSSHDERVYKNMIQTDAAINPGNSGGPLVNVLGQVIGINNFIFTSGGGSEGIGFARPINFVKKFITEAKKHGKIRPAWIGLWLQDITPDIAEELDVLKVGIIVTNVDAKSPSERTGIKTGDRIVEINNLRIRRVSDWDRFIANVFVDEELEIVLMRNENTIKAKIFVQEFQFSGTKGRFGLFVEDISSQLAKKYGIGYKDGVIVLKVEENGVGERLGIRAGDVILKIDDKRIRNKIDFNDAMKNDRPVYFILDRGGLIMQLYLGS